jgi:hypothetical protein
MLSMTFHLVTLIPFICCSLILNTHSLSAHKLTPTTDFLAVYVGQDITSSIYAELKAKTLVPVVNLENLNIPNVTCDKNGVVVHFETDKMAAMAVSEWRSVQDFAVFIGHERNCYQGAGAWRVSAVSNPSARSVALKAIPLEWMEFLEKYSFEMNQLQHPKLDKRDLKKVFKLPLRANLNYNSDTAREENFVLLQSTIGSVRCLNCTSDGFVNINLHMTGNPMDIDTYNITVNGALKVNFGTRIKLTQGPGTNLLKNDLVVIPITPIQLPGIFSIGPELALTFSINTELKQAVMLYSGFGFDSTIDFSAYSNRGLDHPPQVRMGGKHRFMKKHTEFKTSKEFHLEFSLSPNVALAVRAFNFKPLNFGITWNQILLVRVSSCFQKLNIKGLIQDLTRSELWTASLLAIQEVALVFHVGKIPVQYILGKQRIQQLECINCECLQAKKLLNVTDTTPL